MKFAAILLCLLCVACPADDPPPRPVPTPRVPPTPTAATADPTLRWAIAEPTAIVPMDAVTPDDLLVVDALYDSLTRWGDDLAAQPSVARRWTSSRKGRTWTFELDPRALFSDGAPVTAHTFVRTWNVMARSGAAHHHLRDIAGYRRVRAGAAPRLAGIRAQGLRRLEVRLSRPLADFPAVVAHPALGPMRNPRREREADRPTGNGPFRMAEPWAHDRFVRLARVGRPGATDSLGTEVHEVVFSIADPASAYIAYEQGGVDVAAVPPGALTAEPPPAEPSTRYRGPGLLRGDLPTVYLLTFNMRRGAFRSADARRGVAFGLDRDRIAREVFDSAASPGWSVSSPALPGGRRRTCLRCVHDPDQARRLLRSAGVRRLTLWINSGGDHEAVAEQIADDLRQVGVDVVVRAPSFARFQAALRRGEPGLFRFGWSADYPTLDNVLRPLFHSQSTPASGGANYGRYRRSDVDALLDRAAREPRRSRRLALYRRAEDLVVGRDQAIIPVAVLRRRTVVAPRVRNLTYGPMGDVDLLRVRIAERED